MLSSKLMDRLVVFKRRHRAQILSSSSHPAHLFFFLPPTTLSVHLPYALFELFLILLLFGKITRRIY